MIERSKRSCYAQAEIHQAIEQSALGDERLCLRRRQQRDGRRGDEKEG